MSTASPPLVLLHGLGTDHRDFDRIAPLLEDDFDVLALDLPGQGGAPPLAGRPDIAGLTDAVEAVLDARGVQTAHVLGNSLGGRIALELATRGRARSVVAISPSGLSILPERLAQVWAMTATAAAMSIASPMFGQLSRPHAGCAFLLSGLRARPWLSVRSEADAMIGGFSSPEIGRIIRWAIAADVPSALHRIDCPVLLLQGTGDAIAAGQTLRFRTLIPAARFRALLGAGHAAHSDVPVRVAHLVRRNAALAR